QKFDLTGAFLTKWGSPGANDGQFNLPGGLAVNGVGDVYVTDLQNDRVQAFDAAGTFLLKFGATGSNPGQFSSPSDIALGPAGAIYITDSDNDGVQKFVDANVPVQPITWGHLKNRYASR